MAILVIQLARFGDVFQSWPALKALRRTHPEANLHFLVRERFAAAADGLRELGVTVHILPTAKILHPLIHGAGGEPRDEAAAINEIENFLIPLREKKFERIINLSFSPFSSYLVDDISAETTSVVGYTRHADGFLKIPDDSSAYFYGQVGVGKSNRYHLCEVFAAVAGVDLEPGDFSHPAKVGAKGNTVIVHLGASQASKTYPAEMWSEVLRGLVGGVDGSIMLVGSSSERSLSEAVTSRVKSGRILNRVGQSNMADLCRWVNEAALVIGADSAPVAIANLTGTRVLNLSCSTVNFWETGPRTEGSRVLFEEEMHQILPSSVVSEAISILKGGEPTPFAISRMSDTYVIGTALPLREPAGGDSSRTFRWNLIRALYTATDYPELPENFSPLAFHRLFDLAELAVQQLDQWNISGPTTAITTILSSVDDMLANLPNLDANVRPIVDWFQTERVRFAPGPPADTLKATRALFEQLLWIAAVFHKRSEGNRMLERAAELTKVCAPRLREYDLHAVQDSFQELMSIAQAAATSPTKAGANPWPSVLNRLQNALEKRDFIEAADILESDWTEVLQSAQVKLSWDSGASAKANSPTPDPS